MFIDFITKPEKLGETTVENAREHEEFISHLNYLIAEGWLELEEDDSGNIRLYAT